MPSAVKNSANMTKHLTQAELEARRQAEEEVLPQRQKAKLKKPGFISGSRQANAYWNQILKRMEGLALLDDGTEIFIKDFLGFAEEVENKW